MRRMIGAVILTVALTMNTGCVVPIYHPMPQQRAEQLIFTSENLRMILDEWERIWFLDQPSHMGPLRMHGGLV